MRLPWPEIQSEQRPEETIRQILDYIGWISREMRRVGFHGEDEWAEWALRAGQAYTRLFLPPLPGHGDPYPPDVPPAEAPGVWPDIPAQGIPGMTVRHQLKVIGLLAEELRDGVWLHTRPPEVREWDRRLAEARDLLDHGPNLGIPDEARTTPSPEVIAEARAQEEAVRDHARKRKLRLERLRAEVRKSRPKAARRSASSKAQTGSTAAGPRAKVPSGTAKGRSRKAEAPSRGTAKGPAKAARAKKAKAAKRARPKARKSGAPRPSATGSPTSRRSHSKAAGTGKAAARPARSSPKKSAKAVKRKPASAPKKKAKPKRSPAAKKPTQKKKPGGVARRADTASRKKSPRASASS